MLQYLAVILSVFCLSIQTGMASEPAKIAAIYAKSGIAAQEVIQDLYGIRLAVKIINIQGGIKGRALQLIELDNKSTPLGAASAARQAIRLKVLAVLGAAWSAQSLAMAPVLQKAKIPMISNISTNPKLTRIGNYIFRTCYTDTFQGKIMANFARTDLKAKQAALLTNVSTPYSIDLSKYFRQEFQKLGGKIIWQGKYLQTDTNFYTLLRNIKKIQPEVVFVPGYMRDSGLILSQARRLGIKSVFLGGDGWETGLFYYAKGKPLGRNFFCNHWHPGLNSKRSQTFIKLFQQEFQTMPTSRSATAYDTAMLLASAMQKADTLTSGQIRQALAETKDFPAICGNITFDASGDPVSKPAVIESLDKGRSRFVKMIHLH